MVGTILGELEWRGLIQDVSDRDGINKLKAPDSFYVGYDPTAASLQLGNLVPIIVSLHLARAGLSAIQLFGGATGFIGDPSGRSTERQLLDGSVIESNVQNHKKLVGAIFDRMGVKAHFVNNYDWTAPVGVLDFLRDVGKHFTVNYMLAKDVVKARLDGDGISFTEFSYMLLQANDFLHLCKHHQCRLQIGGSDQWGNITAGLELIRKKAQADAFALSIPLILDSHGKKFGKSEGGTLWLDPNATSPYRFHQFWLNVEDADVIRYLKIFTFLEHSTILELERSVATAPEKREAQRVLADNVCSLVHGNEATMAAKKGATVLFGGSIEGMDTSEILEIFKDVPSSNIARTSLAALDIFDLFVKTGLSKSKGEARRLIESGGGYLNNERIADASSALSTERIRSSELLILRAGKKSYHLVKLT